MKLPKRWVSERTFAWRGRDRRHSKDYEWSPESSEAWVRISAIGQMLRRLAPDEERKQAPFKYSEKPGSLAFRIASKFYNGRGTTEQWIKEGKNALRWTRLSCGRFKDNQVRLRLFALRQPGELPAAAGALLSRYRLGR